MKDKPTLAIHPILFALFPVIFLYTKNIDEIYFRHVLWPLIFVFGVTLTLWFALNIFYKSWHKSGLVTSCIVLFMFSYGNITEKFISTFNLNLDTHASPLILVWFALLGVVLLGVFRIEKSLVQWTKIFNLVALCLILLNGINILSFNFHPDNPFQNNSLLGTEDLCDTPLKASKRPNIFYLIFDAHIGPSGLKQLGHNNSWFIDALKERGFFVAEKSHSNYIHTPLSLASSLNYTYLDNLSDKLHQTGPHLTDLKKVYPLMDSNKTFRFLKKLGYQVIYCPTDTIFFVHNPTSADLVLNQNNGPWNGVTLELLRNTPFFRNRWMLIRLHRDRILNGLQEIKSIKDHPKPFILFAHILSPHFPAVFDENGNFPKKTTLRSFDAKIEKFLPQMEYLDKQILEIIDLLQDDKNPPVIVIQGDHGIRDLIENKQAVTKSGPAHVGFSILNAYYLPGYDTAQLYDRISPVNSFRIIFNHYFGTNLELLEDRSFFCSKKSLYDFQDVTDFLTENPPNISEIAKKSYLVE